MNKCVKGLIWVTITGVWSASGQAAESAVSPGLGCNQLGRELALRSVEELGLGLDAAQRSNLAALAETVCLEFQSLPVREQAVFESSPETAVPPPVMANEEDKKDGFFSLEKIAPEDRVRRPGLKRL